MSYVSYISYVCKLDELYELYKLYEFFMNHLFFECTKKVILISLNTTFFVLKNFSKTFRKYKKMTNSKYKIKNIEKKYLNIMQKNPFLRINNGLLEKVL